MTKREAKQQAHGIVSRLIDSYFDVGQPYDDGERYDHPEDDVERLAEALREIRDYHWRGAGPRFQL